MAESITTRVKYFDGHLELRQYQKIKDSGVAVGIGAEDGNVWVVDQRTLDAVCVYPNEALDVGRMLLNAQFAIQKYKDHLVYLEEDDEAEGEFDESEIAHMLDQEGQTYDVVINDYTGDQQIILRDLEDPDSVTVPFEAAVGVASVLINLSLVQLTEH